MKLNRLALFVAAFAAFSCSDDTETDNRGSVEYTFQEGGELRQLEDDVTWDAESRDAVLVMFTGKIVPNEDAPFEMTHLRTIDAPLYRDVDEDLGPEQYVTRVDVVDSGGKVLWADRINSLYQILLYLEIVLAETSPIALSVEQVYRFINMQYSSLLDFGVTIPTGLAGAQEVVFSVKNTAGEFVESGRFNYADLMSDKVAPSVDTEVTTVAENGPARDTIDIAVIGDGYLAADRDKFLRDVEAVSARLFETEPFKSNREAFNVHAVYVESEERGAGYDCTGNIIDDRDCKNDLRDTPFGTTFVITALADLLNLELGDTSDRVAMPLQVGRVLEAGAAAGADEILLISNTDRTSGFAGLYFSVVTAFDGRVQFPHVAVHELGHSFGVLGDEYNIEGDPCLENEPTIPLPVNIAPSVDNIKWAHWVANGAALPTPDSQADAIDVGAYEGAYNCDPLFRPSFECKMNSSSEEFCPVCSEQLTKRVFGTIDPIPDGITFIAAENGLSVEVPDTDIPRKYRWTLAGEEISINGDLTLPVLPSETTALTLTAEVDSEFVRQPSARMKQSRTIWIRQ